MSETSLPSEDTLTHEGLNPAGNGRVLILGCGALAREILAVIDANGLTHIDLQCLPAILHNHPEKIVPAVREAVAKANNYSEIFLAYGDCGTGGALKKTADELGLEMMPGPHCYAFYEGTEDFIKKSETEFTSFYLTDFLVRQFDAFIWRPLGLDRHPELRDAYFGNYEKLVYQAQTSDAELTDKAQICAKRLGLAFERRETGYGELATELINLNITP